MVFKTFSGDLSSFSSQFGIFNKSFKQIGENKYWGNLKDNWNNASKNPIAKGKAVISTGNPFKAIFGTDKKTIEQEITNLKSQMVANPEIFNSSQTVAQLRGVQAEVIAGTRNWEDYFKTYEGGDKALRQHLVNEGALISGNAQDVTNSVNNFNRGLEQNIRNLERSTLAAKAMGVAAKAASLAFNIGLGVAISFGIQWIFDLINAEEKAIEKAQEAKSQIDEIKKSFEDMKKSTDDVKDRFAELAQGVDNLGKANQSKGDLSTDEYKEFLDLSNKLSDIFPQLTKGYDNNGNAILDLTGNVDGIVGSLNELLEVEQKIANQEVLDKLPDVWEQQQKDLYKYRKELNESNTYFRRYSDVLKNGTFRLNMTPAMDDNGSKEFKDRITKTLKNTGVSLKDVTVSSEIVGTRYGYDEIKTLDFNSLPEDKKNKVFGEIGTFVKEYENNVVTAKNKISKANQEIASEISLILSDDDMFKDMDENLKFELQSMLKDWDWAEIISNSGVDENNPDEVAGWVEQNIISAIASIDDENIRSQLVSVLQGSLSIGDKISLLDSLQNEYGFSEANPLFVYIEAQYKDTENIAERLATKVADDANDKIKNLSLDDLKVADTLEIPEDTLLSWDELLRRIEFAKREAKGGLTIDEVISSDKYKSILEEYNNIIEEPGKENSYEFAFSKLRELETIMADIDNAAKAAGMSTDQFISEFSKIKDIPEPNWLSNFVRRNSSNLSNTFSDIFDGTDSEALKTNKETIDNYKSSISSLQTALTSLYSGNYSTEELYEALATLQEIASLNGIEIDFSEIDLSTSEGIAELQKQAEELGTKLSDKVIKNLGISPLSSFAQGLRNISDEAINTKAKLDAFNNTVSTFQSDISSLQGALTTLYQDNYSSSELMDSLMSIKQWADNNKIDIDLSGLEDASQLSEKIEKSVDEYVNKTIKALNIDPNSNFAKMLRDVETQAVKVKAKIAGVTNSMSDLKGVYNTVSGAVEEYAEKGNLSVDTLTSLLQLEPKYLALLVDNNGQLKLNKESFKKLALAQLDEAKAAIEARYRTKLEEISLSDLGETADTTKGSVTDFFDSVLNILSGNNSDNVINFLDRLTGGLLGVNQAAQGATEVDLDSLYKSAHDKNAKAAEQAQKEYNAGMAVISAGAKGVLDPDTYFGNNGDNDDKSSSKDTTAPHRAETNDNFYDYYSPWLDDKKNALEKFTDENERLDKLWTKAVESGNTEAMKSVMEAYQANNDAYTKALEISVYDAENKTQTMLERLYKIAPEFKGMTVDEILGNKTLQTSVEKRFDDQLTANSNAQYNAEQKEDWTSKANLEDTAKELNKNKSEVSAIISGLESINDETKEWANTLQDLPTKGLEQISSYYDEIHRQRGIQRGRLADNYGTEEAQIQSLLNDMADYHAQAEILRNTLDENGNRIYSEDSQAIHDLQENWRAAAKEVEELREQAHSRVQDALSEQVSTVDFKIEVIGEKDFDKTSELLSEKADLVKRQMWNVSQEKKRLDEQFADNKDSEQYIEAMKALDNEERSLYGTLQDVYDKQKDIAKQRADVIKNTEDTVIDMLKDKYQTMKDEYQKRIDLEKEYIDKRKEALQRLLSMYEKKWDIEDKDAERQDKLADRAKLATQRNDLGNAASSGDLTALSKAEDLDEQIRDLDNDIANDAKEAYRQSVRDRIQDEIDNLDDLSAKYDTDLEKFNSLLDEKLKNENLYAEAHKAITTGIFEDAYGVEKSLTEAYKEYINRTADGFSWIGEETMSSFNQGLIETNKNLEDLRDILGQISELGVRDWFEAKGHKVDWDNDSKEVIIDENTRISQDEFKRSEDGKLIATPEQMNEISDKFGLSKTGTVSQKSITETDTKKGLEYDKEDTKTPKSINEVKGIQLTTADLIRRLGGDPTKTLEVPFTNNDSTKALKDINSKLDQYLNYDVKPAEIHVTNQITVQGNLDGITLEDVTREINRNMNNIADFTVNKMSKTLSSMGTIGRRR